MEFVDEERNQGRWSPLKGLQEYAEAGGVRCKVQSLKDKGHRKELRDKEKLLKHAEEAAAIAEGMDGTNTKVFNEKKTTLTDIQIGMKKDIIVPSFKTTVHVFNQHFMILRELQHKIILLQQAYYAQQDHKKTWQ